MHDSFRIDRFFKLIIELYLSFSTLIFIVLNCNLVFHRAIRETTAYDCNYDNVMHPVEIRWHSFILQIQE